MTLGVILIGLGMSGEAHDMYGDWKQANGSSCCKGEDCRPTIAYHDDEGWHARIRPGPEGVVLVPRSAILQGHAPDGRCHVCERGGSVMCFRGCDPMSEFVPPAITPPIYEVVTRPFR